VRPDTLTFALDRRKLRQVRRREGCYLLRSNLPGEVPAQLRRWYIQLTEVEQAFRELKRNPGIRPIDHQRDACIKAHLFPAFLAYRLQVTLRARLRALAPGLTPRAAPDNLAAIHRFAGYLPTTDGRTLILSRCTEPEQAQWILLDRLRLTMPEPPPPRTASTLQTRSA
jgi:hypothetical protein